MSTLHRLFAATAFASALGALATPILAAPNDCASRGGYWEHRSETMEQHHKRLHTALKLTPEQESAWTRLVDAVPPPTAPDVGKADDWSKLTTPERADRMMERMKAHQARMADHLAAMKAFYGVLTATQKKTFDDFHAGPRAGMDGKREGRGNPRAAP